MAEGVAVCLCENSGNCCLNIDQIRLLFILFDRNGVVQWVY